MGRSSYAARIIIIALALVLAFMYLALRLYNVQIVEHNTLYSKAKKKYTAVKKIRGYVGKFMTKMVICLLEMSLAQILELILNL